MATVLHKPAAVAAHLGCSVRHVYNLITAGHLAVIDLGHGRTPKLRIRDDALQTYIDQRTYRAGRTAQNPATKGSDPKR